MKVFRFGEFELDADSEELSRDGELLPLARQPCRVLGLLVSRAGRTVSRAEIRDHVWGEEHVAAELGINSCIKKIRAQLGDDPRSPSFVKTVPRRGYRFVGAVKSDQVGVVQVGGSSFPVRRWVLAASVLLVVLMWSFGGWRGDVASPASDPSQAVNPQPSVAVLPFENLSGDESADYLAAGLTEETITQLGGVDPEMMTVIARGSVVQAVHGDSSVQEIAAATGVQFVVEGSVQVEGERLRTTVRLVDGTTGAQIAVRVYEASNADSLGSRGELASRIAGWLVEELVGEEQFDFPKSNAPVSSVAYEAFLRGLYQLHLGTAEGYLAARDYFQAAIDEEADYSPAWSGLAESELWLHWFGSAAKSGAVQRSRSAAQRAISLDPNAAAPHLLLGYAALYIDYDFVVARQELHFGVVNEPGSARAQAWYGALLSALGEHEEAVRRAALSRQLDPLTMATRADLCWLLNYADRFEEAVAACGHALDLRPGDVWTTLGKVEALRNLGKPEEVVAALSEIAPGGSSGDVAYGWREQAEGELVLQRAWSWFGTAVAKQGRPLTAAYIAVRMGNAEDALEELEKAWRSRSMLLVFLGVDPRFDDLRGHPRFEELLFKLGLNRTLEVAVSF